MLWSTDLADLEGMKHYLPGLEEKLDLESRLGDFCELVKNEQQFSTYCDTDSQVH